MAVGSKAHVGVFPFWIWHCSDWCSHTRQSKVARLLDHWLNVERSSIIWHRLSRWSFSCLFCLMLTLGLSKSKSRILKIRCGFIGSSKKFELWAGSNPFWRLFLRALEDRHWETREMHTKWDNKKCSFYMLYVFGAFGQKLVSLLNYTLRVDKGDNGGKMWKVICWYLLLAERRQAIKWIKQLKATGRRKTFSCPKPYLDFLCINFIQVLQVFTIRLKQAIETYTAKLIQAVLAIQNSQRNMLRISLHSNWAVCRTNPRDTLRSVSLVSCCAVWTSTLTTSKRAAASYAIVSLLNSRVGQLSCHLICWQWVVSTGCQLAWQRSQSKRKLLCGRCVGFANNDVWSGILAQVHQAFHLSPWDETDKTTCRAKDFTQNSNSAFWRTYNRNTTSSTSFGQIVSNCNLMQLPQATKTQRHKVTSHLSFSEMDFVETGRDHLWKRWKP